MTFAAPASGGPQGFNYVDNAFSTFGDVSAGLTFNTDGQVTGINTGKQNWFSPTISGIGSSYWLEVGTPTSGSFTVGTINTRLALSSSRSFYVTTGGGGVIRTAQVVAPYNIYDAASGGTSVATGTLDFFAEYDGS